MVAKQGKVDKIIVSNITVLKAKYKPAGYAAISTAIKSLIKADKQRGITTFLVAIDDKNSLGKNCVTNPADPKQNKNAIDYVYKTYTPDYILILGSIDVIPHQDLKNPLYKPRSEDDKFAFGDIPYSCDHPYSQNPHDFFGPTRVVSRLPDLTGGTDPKYLVNLLHLSSKYTQKDQSKYLKYFGVSAEVWNDSTTLSISNIFGDSANMKSVPLSNSNWPASSLGLLSHYFNCHGFRNTPHFYDQSAQDPKANPASLDAEYIDGKITEGTVVAAECCFSAQLYDPVVEAAYNPICNAYLGSGAYGFFGSTTLAYGPDTGNDNADLICQYFFDSVLRGASLGRAALEARQRFIQNAKMSDPANVKTIAQFNLYGDPSLTPVKMPRNITPPTPKHNIAAQMITARVERSARRRDLFSRGFALAQSQPRIKVIARASGRVTRATLTRAAKQNGINQTQVLTFDVKQPPMANSIPSSLLTKELFPNRVHVVFDA